MKRFPFGLYRVAGDSMLPTYRPGDLLLGARWLRPRVGRTVVVLLRELPIIKRVVRREPGGYWIEGDNTAVSTDSRSFGIVPAGAIEAVIIARLARGR